jgi:tetratricopeptide (TPR) repeat protein
MQPSNRDLVGRALDALAAGLAGPVDAVMTKKSGGPDWNEEWARKDAVPGRRPPRRSKTDAYVLLNAIKTFPRAFGPLLNSVQREWASDLLDLRNKWAHAEVSDDDAVAALELAERLLTAVGATSEAWDVRKLRSSSQRIQVGWSAEVGRGYQVRDVDTELDLLWNDGGDRRVWIRGGPGLGKSFTARRVMQDAVLDDSETREDVLIWVDSASPETVTERFAEVVDRLRRTRFALSGAAKDDPSKKARTLLETLATSTWRWLVVLDNADANALIDARLIPSGSNPRGRVLLTTLDQGNRLENHGRVVSARLFAPAEAQEYLRSEVHARPGGSALRTASGFEVEALTRAVGHHPLALAIAASTITANAMDVTDWLNEFAATAVIDAAADSADPGGYPNLIGATWQIALDNASAGLPEGVVERAALVAAVQDPDGHPTWVWDCDPVAQWVAAGATLARTHGKPVVVQRLMDHGIVELRGDSWKRGSVAIHPLAARAVRELASSETIAALVDAVARAWLLRISDPGGAPLKLMRRNLTPLLALPGLPDQTRDLVRVLLAYELPSPEVLREQAVNLDDALAIHLMRGGITGLRSLATEYVSIGRDEDALGHGHAARKRFEAAAGILQDLLNDTTVNGQERAELLQALGEVQEALGDPDAARAGYREAVRLLEQHLDAQDTGSSGSVLASLLELHTTLDTPLVDRESLEHRVDQFVESLTLDDVPADRSSLLLDIAKRKVLADQLRAMGRNADVIRVLEHAQAAAQDLGARYELKALARAISEAQIASADVAAAIATLTAVLAQDEVWTGRDDLVLLASLRYRAGDAAAGQQQLEEATDRLPEEAGENDIPAALEEAEADFVGRFWRSHNQVRLSTLASVAAEREQWDDAIALKRAELDSIADAPIEDPVDHERRIATSHNGLAFLCWTSGRLEEAHDHASRAVRIGEMLLELEPADDSARNLVGEARFWQGATSARLGDDDGAAVQLQQALSLFDDVGSYLLDSALDELGEVYVRLGREEEALAVVDSRVDRCDAAAQQAPDDPDAQLKLAWALRQQATVRYQLLGADADLSGPARRMLEICTTIVDLDPRNHAAVKQLALAIVLVGGSAEADGTEEEDLPHLIAAAEPVRAFVDGHPEELDTQYRLGGCLMVISSLLAATDRLHEAVDYANRAVGILLLVTELEQQPRGADIALRNHAEILRALGRESEASDADSQADEMERRFPPQ